MHQAVLTYLESVKKLFPSHFKDTEVLDVGSYDINGNNRAILENCTYIGLDIYPGKNVEIVSAIGDYRPNKQFKLILCTEVLEHDKTRKEDLLYMYKLLDTGGLLVATCANIARREHGTTSRGPADSPATNDYYRNIDAQDILSVLPQAIVKEDPTRRDLYFYVVKR